MSSSRVGPWSPPAPFAYGESIERVLFCALQSDADAGGEYNYCILHALLCIQMMGAQVKLVAWQVTRFFIQKGPLERVLAVLSLANWIWYKLTLKMVGYSYSEHMLLSLNTIVVQFDMDIL
jgi:hypothetical protein